MKLLRKKDVQAKVGLGRSSLEDLRRRDPTFPQPVQLGARAIAFVESEIDEWIANLPRAGTDNGAADGGRRW